MEPMPHFSPLLQKILARCPQLLSKNISTNPKIVLDFFNYKKFCFLIFSYKKGNLQNPIFFYISDFVIKKFEKKKFFDFGIQILTFL